MFFLQLLAQLDSRRLCCPEWQRVSCGRDTQARSQFGDALGCRSLVCTCCVAKCVLKPRHPGGNFLCGRSLDSLDCRDSVDPWFTGQVADSHGTVQYRTYRILS